MSSSSARGEQELGADEDDEGGGSAVSARACSVPFSDSGSTKLRKRLNRRWLPCFLRRWRRLELVDKATDTTDLCLLGDAFEAVGQQHHRPISATDQGILVQPSCTPPGGAECADGLSTCGWILPPAKSSSPRRHLTPPRECPPHGLPPPPRDKDTHPDIVEQPDGEVSRMSRLEAPVHGDAEKLSGGVLPTELPRGDSPGQKPPLWRRAQSPHEVLLEARISRRKNTRGRQDTPPRKEEQTASHSHSSDTRKPTPLLPTPRRDTVRQALAGRTGVLRGPAVAMVCCLLVAVAAYTGVHTFPVCVGKVSWAVMPREALVLELVSVTLLVAAAASILVLMDGLLGLITEVVIAFILIIYNAALVDLVRCLCFMPGRCLWLAALAVPLFMLTLFVLCREKMVVLRRPS